MDVVAEERDSDQTKMIKRMISYRRSVKVPMTLLNLAMRVLVRNYRFFLKHPGKYLQNLPNALVQRMLELIFDEDFTCETSLRLRFCVAMVPHAFRQKFILLLLKNPNISEFDCDKWGDSGKCFNELVENCENIRKITRSGNRSKELQIPFGCLMSWNNLTCLSMKGYFCNSVTLLMLLIYLPKITDLEFSISARTFSMKGVNYLAKMSNLRSLFLEEDPLLQGWKYGHVPVKTIVHAAGRNPGLSKFIFNDAGRRIGQIIKLYAELYPRKNLFIPTILLDDAFSFDWPPNVSIDHLYVEAYSKEDLIRKVCTIPCPVRSLTLDCYYDHHICGILKKFGPHIQNLVLRSCIDGKYFNASYNLFNVLTLCPKLETLEINNYIVKAIDTVSSLNITPQLFQKFKSFTGPSNESLPDSRKMNYLFKAFLLGSENYDERLLVRASQVEAVEEALSEDSKCLYRLREIILDFQHHEPSTKDTVYYALKVVLDVMKNCPYLMSVVICTSEDNKEIFTDELFGTHEYFVELCEFIKLKMGRVAKKRVAEKEEKIQRSFSCILPASVGGKIRNEIIKMMAGLDEDAWRARIKQMVKSSYGVKAPQTLLALVIHSIGKNYQHFLDCPGKPFRNLPNTLVQIMLKVIFDKDRSNLISMPIIPCAARRDFILLLLNNPNISEFDCDKWGDTGLYYQHLVENCPNIHKITRSGTRSQELQIPLADLMKWKNLTCISMIGYFCSTLNLRLMQRNCPKITDLEFSVSARTFSMKGVDHLAKMSNLRSLSLQEDPLLQGWKFDRIPVKTIVHSAGKNPGVLKFKFNDSGRRIAQIVELYGETYPHKNILIPEIWLDEECFFNWPPNVFIDHLHVEAYSRKCLIKSVCTIPCPIRSLTLDCDYDHHISEILRELGPHIQNSVLQSSIDGKYFNTSYNLLNVLTLCPKLETLEINDNIVKAMDILSSLYLTPQYFKNFKSFSGPSNKSLPDSRMMNHLFKAFLLGSENYNRSLHVNASQVEALEEALEEDPKCLCRLKEIYLDFEHHSPVTEETVRYAVKVLEDVMFNSPFMETIVIRTCKNEIDLIVQELLHKYSRFVRCSKLVDVLFILTYSNC